MTWQTIEGHDAVVDKFRRAIGTGRLASAFLFVGPAGVGKHTFALKLAQALLCERHPEQMLDPCGHCPACQQAAAKTHPDLLLVDRPDRTGVISVEALIGDREHRMRQGLCYDISLKPVRGGRKIAIIDDADYLKQPEASNCLLKTLEEPPPKSVIILISTSEQKQLPTIRSRSQVVRFRPLSDESVARVLVATGFVSDARTASQLAATADGSVPRAMLLADETMREFRESLLAYLSDPWADSVEFAKSLGTFVNQAGKEAPPRRIRLQQIFDMATDFYRQLMRALVGLPPRGDQRLVQAVQAACAASACADETAALCLERCLDAPQQLLANANVSTLSEAWLDDLAVIGRTGFLPSMP